MSKPKLKGLGRGLDALLAHENQGEDRLQSLPVTALQAGVYQPRSHMDQAALAALADSIRVQGVIQPVVVREIGLGRYEIIAGERRWRAAQLAGLADIPAVIRTVPDQAALAIALIENIQREQLDPLEEATGVQRLIDEFHMTHESTAAALGRSRSAISNLLRLLTLPEPVQVLVHEKKLDMGHARALLALPVLQQIEWAQHAATQQWSVRETERRIQHYLHHSAVQKKVALQQDPDIRRLEETLSDQLGTTVHIRHGKRGNGRLTIEYSDLAQLDEILHGLQKKTAKNKGL